MILCNERQIAFAAIIIYVIILDGFIVFQIIAYTNFNREQENIDFEKQNKIERGEGTVNIY